MQRQGPLVLVVLLLLFGGIAAFFFWPTGEAPPVAPRGEGDTGPRVVTERRAGDEDGERVAADSGTRTEVVEASAPNAHLDPSVRAALAGFEGRVVDSAGAPVADSLVRIYRFAADTFLRTASGAFAEESVREPELIAGETRTGGDGRFTVQGVFPRAFFLLRADFDGDAPTNKIIERCPGPAEMVDLGDIVLQDAGILVGRVVDDADEPVAGALVRAVDLPGELLSMVPVERFDPNGALIVKQNETEMVLTFPAWAAKRFDELPIPTTRTLDDGTFRLTGVVPGGNLVAVTSTGLLSWIKGRVDVSAGEEEDLGEIRMREGEVVWGTVKDEDGKPIEGAQVAVAPKTRFNQAPVHFASFTAPTDAKGEFELGGFPPGEVYAAARRDRGEPWKLVGPLDGVDEIVIALPTEHILSVRVRDAEGEPVADPRFQVTAGRKNRGSIEMAMFGMNQPVTLGERVEHDAKEADLHRITGLPKGEYTLLVGAEGHAVDAVSVTLDADTEVTVTLPGEQTFEVIALDFAGAPVRGAEVFVEARGEGFPDAPIRAGVTGETGRVKVGGIRAENVRVTAAHPAFGNAHGETTIPAPGPLSLQFTQVGSIQGNLLEGGAQPTPGKWMLVCMPRGGNRGRGAMPDLPQLTAPGLDGSFRIVGLPPGSYRLQVVRSVDVLTSPGKAMDFGMMMFMQGETDEQDVEVTPGQTAQITLDALAGKMVTGPSAMVSGSVMVDGRPATGYLLSGWGQGRRISAEIDAAGQFDLGPVAVGNLRLQLMQKPSGNFLEMRRMGQQLWSGNYEIKEGEDRILDVQVTISRIEGVVYAPDGRPAENVQVSANGRIEQQAADGSTSQSNVWFREETDANGRFVFEQVPCGVYSLEAQNDEVGRGQLADVQATDGFGVRNLQIQLDRVYTARGTLDLSIFGEQKPRWLSIRFRPVGGDDNDGNWIQVDNEDGTFEAEGLSSGEYELLIYHNLRDADFGGQLVGDRRVRVDGADVEGVRIRAVPQQKDG